MNTSKTILALALLLTTVAGRAQNASEPNALKRAISSLSGEAEFYTSLNDGFSPLWHSANEDGHVDVQGGFSSLELYIGHDEHNLPKKWRLSWKAGLEFALGYKNDYIRENEFSIEIPEAYVDLDYKRVRLSIGTKLGRGNELKGTLTSGSQTFSKNAHPVPSVRFELPEYWNISPWIAIKGHFGYGLMLDGNWQNEYVNDGVDDAGLPLANRYAKNAFLHTKAGYLRIGNEKKFPLTFEGGLEMACMFGGTIYNFGEEKQTIEMPSGISDFFKAIYSGGSDTTDGPYSNAGGNTVGSWLFALNYHGKDWKAKLYYDHFFEDHSQMFLQYGWLDGLIGLEVELPENRFVSRVCYEHLKTSYQSGPVYHDHTDALPVQISGGDDYYNHVLYQGWQYFGISMGNPLFVSPLYRNDGSLRFDANRFVAHYIALAGTPFKGLDYELRYSYMTSWGTYNLPFETERYQNSFALALNWGPERIGHLALPGWSANMTIGFDKGSIIGDNFGVGFGVIKEF